MPTENATDGAAGAQLPEQPALPGLPATAPAVQDTTHAEARALFEVALAGVPWADRYAALLDDGWRWRQAAYIAWASLPKSGRQPRHAKDLADLLGCAPVMFSVWRRRNPAINAVIAKFAVTGLLEAAPDIVDALVESASDPSYKHAPDRRLALEMAGLYTPRQQHQVGPLAEDGDLESMTEDQLRRLAAMDDGAND